MKDQDIIKAVAELDGYEFDEVRLSSVIWHYVTIDFMLYKNGNCKYFAPPYLTSRDVIIGVIKKKVNKITCHSFFDTLGIVVAQDTSDCDGVYEYQGDGSYYEMWLLFMATPRQLCEALLRLTGKWKD